MHFPLQAGGAVRIKRPKSSPLWKETISEGASIHILINLFEYHTRLPCTSIDPDFELTYLQNNLCDVLGRTQSVQIQDPKSSFVICQLNGTANLTPPKIWADW